ncbi:hypothetical protein NUSPORA_00732 [Nucleospora cyclopteri]
MKEGMKSCKEDENAQNYLEATDDDVIRKPDTPKDVNNSFKMHKIPSKRNFIDDSLTDLLEDSESSFEIHKRKKIGMKLSDVIKSPYQLIDKFYYSGFNFTFGLGKEEIFHILNQVKEFDGVERHYLNPKSYTDNILITVVTQDQISEKIRQFFHETEPLCHLFDEDCEKMNFRRHFLKSQYKIKSIKSNPKTAEYKYVDQFKYFKVYKVYGKLIILQIALSIKKSDLFEQVKKLDTVSITDKEGNEYCGCIAQINTTRIVLKTPVYKKEIKIKSIRTPVVKFLLTYRLKFN